MNALDEQRESLWWLVVSPTTWAVHFLVSYATAAVWCAKIAGRDATLAPVRAAIVAYSVVALAIIGWVGLHGLRRHRYGTATVPHDFDTPEDRHRFIGFAVLLLSTISGIAVLYVAITVIWFGTCR